MGNDDPFNDEADLSDISHAHFEVEGMEAKYNKNSVRQVVLGKEIRPRNEKNETPDNEYVGATPYASVATVAAVRTMLFQESVPKATNHVIISMTSKVRESSYKLYSHANTCVFGRGTLFVYDFNRSVNVKGNYAKPGLI